MSSQFQKTALVTGASAGMGKDAAFRLINEGYTVYVAARRLEKMRDLEEAGAHLIAMDISSDKDVLAAVEQIHNECGGVGVLVNNAGFGMYGAIEDTSLGEARYQFEVNLFGLARLTQLLLPAMRENGFGKIINVSSVGGKIYSPLGAWYHATKHALEGWSDCLRLEVAQFGIDVIIIEPGIILTEFGDVVSSPMLERSGSGPYASMADASAKAMSGAYKDGVGSPPGVISDLIMKSIKTGKPRTRYHGGKMAAMLLFFRHWLPDRAFDRLIMSQVKRVMKEA
ncbi:oxidoreductase [Roseibium sp. MMSF_3544]|uniref:oxidoreductase n=1 Tax=unclassified Roseibium TaxID=2629323 RepID=UPI00273DC31A|nr:oxidoreductase [Roseibium sp. MMSF_3544]